MGLDGEGVGDFVATVRREQPDLILVTGDTAESGDVVGLLEQLGRIAALYFVLCNHDFYRSTIAEVRQRARHEPMVAHGRPDPAHRDDDPRRRRRLGPEPRASTPELPRAIARERPPQPVTPQRSTAPEVIPPAEDTPRYLK